MPKIRSSPKLKGTPSIGIGSGTSKAGTAKASKLLAASLEVPRMVQDCFFVLSLPQISHGGAGV